MTIGYTMNSEHTLCEDALKSSYERYKAILQASIDGFLMLDLDGRILEVNDSYCRMSGYSELELLSMTVFDLEALKAHELTDSNIARIKKWSEARFETRHRCKDGNIIDVEISGRYCTFETGRIMLFLRDITSLRQAEKEREQFFKFFQTSADLMCIADPNGNFIKTNPAFSETLGYSEMELTSKGYVEFIHPDDKQVTLEELALQQQRGFSSNFRNRYICKNGSVKWLSWRVSYDKDEGIAYGTARDITDVKKTEEELLESEKRMSLAMQAGNMGLFDLNLNTGEAVVNPEYVQMLGYDPADLQVSVSLWVDRLHPDDRERVESVYNDYVSGKIPHYNVEFRQRTMDGDWKWILSYGRIMERDDDGAPRRMLGVHVDISERKQAEESLRQMEQKLRHIVENSTNLFYMHTTNHVLTYVSPQSWKFFDCAPQDVKVDWTNLITDNPLNRVALESTQRAIDTGERQPPYQVECISRKGRKIWVEVNETPLVENGRTQLIVGSLTDITERKQAEGTLRASHNLLHSIIENVPIRLFWKDTESRYLGCNTAFAHDAGFSHPEELLGKDDFQMVWREQAELYRSDDKRVMASGMPIIGIEEPQTTPDGHIIFLRTSKVPLLDSEHKVVGLLGIYEDITQRKQSEEALRASEEQLRVIFDASQAGIILVAPHGSILFANNRMAEMFGMPLGQLIGSSYLEHLHDEERMNGNERMERLIRGEIQAVSSERHYIRADGSDFWGFLSGKRLENPDGTLRALVGIIADISERKRVEDALHESESRLRFALEGSNEGLWDVQMRTKTTYLSPRSWEILGYLPGEDGEVINDWSDLVHPDDLQVTNERLREHIEGLTPIFQVEQRLRIKTGEWKWVLTRGKVVARSEDGTPLRITGTHTDLTEQKILQEQLNQAQKLESVGRLAGGVAHDFNNMLSVILGHAQLALMRETDTSPLRESLNQIQQAAERSAGIVSQLLAFACKQTITPKILDLNETVTSMFKMISRLIGENIVLAWQPCDGVWPIRMDTSQIDQILVNLCINARDSITGIGRISIETNNKNCDAAFCVRHKASIPGEFVQLTVRDNGCGMDNETVKMIFEPFFTTKEMGQGTGLGLATVYGIVKQNNGFIDVDTEPGLGTCFNIYLPRYKGKELESQKEGPTKLAERGKETVLMVEDEPAILDMGKQLLEMQGYRVLTAGTPGEAIRLAIEYAGEIHLLLTDVIMPEMNGRELAKKLLTLYPGLKRLFMSGYTADVIAHHGVLDEGVHFIQKPFTLAALAAKVRETLDK